MTGRGRVAATAVGLVLVAGFCAVRFEATTDITDFLDAPGSAMEGALSRRLSRSEATRTMVLSVAAPDLALALETSAQLAASLRRDPVVAWVSSGPDPDLPQTLETLYFEHRYQLLSSDPETSLPPRFDDRGLSEAAAALKRALAGPLAPLVRGVAAADPLLAFPGLLRRLQRASSPALALRDGRFVSPDGGSAIVFVGTAYPALDSEHHAPLLARLEQDFAALDAAAGGVLELEMSAVQRFAVRAATAMRADVTRIGILSAIGIAVLFVVVFRSVRLIGVASLPLVAGLLCGLAACLLVYGRINALTLAFGGALVGVVIDYPIHLLAHWLLEDDTPDASGALRRVWPGIRLGAATSFVGFAALAAAGFPGIREIGIFAGAGIAGAVVVTASALPFLVPARRASGTTAERVAGALSSGIAWLTRHRAAAAAVPAVALLVCALGLPGLRFTDDVKALSPVDPELVAEEGRVRDRVLGTETSQVVIALGRDDEDALARNDRVAGLLAELVAEGALEEFRSLHDFVWSAALQRRNEDVVRSQPDLGPRFVAALAREGFKPGAFEPFLASLDARPPPLRLDDLTGSALGHWIRPFVLPRDTREGPVESRVALVTLLRGVSDPARLAAGLSQIDGAVFFDQLALLEAGYRSLRRAAGIMIGLGIVAVLLLLWLHYRSLSDTAVALVPALLAAGTTAALISLGGGALNLVHLFGLLLILGMGVDYGVFLAETARQGESVGATALGLVLSCTTSVLGLGLLALSSNPGLRALGATTAIGVISSLLLGPAVLAILSRPDRGSPAA